MPKRSQTFDFPFLGREKEKEFLGRILDKASAGKGDLEFILGEAGIGKTRLAQAILEDAKEKGFICLTAKCPKGGSLLPYAVWIDCLRQLTRKMNVHEFVEACGNFPQQIFTLMPELDTSNNGGKSQSRSEESTPSIEVLRSRSPALIYEAVTQFLFRSSTRHPLMIFLDDLQWCDKTSFEL